METLTQVLEKNKQRLKAYIEANNLEAYRLYQGEDGSWPVLMDLYGDNAVIHVLEELIPEQYAELEKSLRKVCGTKDFYYKARSKQRVEVPKSPHKEIVIKEYGCSFLINLSDYLDTGLFLDHRETRKWIAAQSKGKTLLNTFAYTGSFSVYAGVAGSTRTYSVDLSKTYGQWTRKNLELNHLSTEDNWIINMDTFEFFKYARKKKLTFDIIIIDPPTFARNKKEYFSVQKEHPRLINEALELLTPAGLILFSNNCLDFVLKKDELSPCKVEQKEDTIPPDFEGSMPHRCFVIRHR